ncbi:MAG TPA: hypothetical protein VK590_13825, partial [Saprospiraceae bacterium]|nr:hypothetical protein [Saprospiraceae bacterium]
DQDFTVFLNVDPASTATSGVDYEAFPASIKIPAGEDEYILPIHILQDYIAESIESIKLEHHSYFSAHTLSEIFIDDSFAFVDSSFINLTKGSIYLGIIINNDTTLITKYQNQLGCDSTYLTFIHVITTSTDHILNSSEIIASPNPVINQLTINSPDRIGIKEWYIIDLLGFKVVSSHKGTNLPLSIDVATLPTGFYQWVGQSEKGIIGAGFIKLAR